MSTYDSVLFDNDGVLVEPPARDSQIDAVCAAFEDVGIDEFDRRDAEALVRNVTVERLEKLAARYSLDAETLWSARERHDERVQLTQFKAGERGPYTDVTALSRLSQPRGVVSNNHHTTVAFVLDFFELRPLFETYYGRPMTIESLERKKPNTYFLERAVDDLDATATLYVGDAESDVKAAHRLGVDSAFVRRAHNRDISLSVEPTYEVDSLHDLVDVVIE